MAIYQSGCISSGGGFGGGIGGVRVNFWHDGGTSDQWLQRDNNHTQASGPATNGDREPWVFPFNGQITTLSYINKKNSTETDLQIFKNGVLQFTWQIRDRKWAIKTNITPITFNAGDRLSVFAKKFDGGDNPDSVLLDVFIKFTSDTQQEIGGSSL